MSIHEISFVFKRVDQGFQVDPVCLIDGKPSPSYKAATAMQTLLADSAEYGKILQCSELKVTLIKKPSSHAIRIDSSDLNLTIQKLTSKTAGFEKETLDSAAAKIFAHLRKPEMAKKKIQDLKDEQALGLLDQLLSHDDPLVEQTLDRILKNPLGISNEIQSTLNHLRVEELDRQREAQASQLVDAKEAHAVAMNAKQLVTLRDVKEFIRNVQEDELEKQLSKNDQELQRHVTNLANQLDELAEIEEDLSKTRSESELKTAITSFIDSAPFFQEMSQLWNSVLKAKDLLVAWNKAYFWQKPLLMLQLTSCGNSIKVSLESLEQKLPERNFRRFIFLLAEFGFIILKEAELEGILPDRKAISFEVASFLRQRISTANKDLARFQNIDDQLKVLRKIIQDRKKLRELSSEELENTSYEISGNLLQNYKNPTVSPNNPIVQRLSAMGQRVAEAEKRYLHSYA